MGLNAKDLKNLSKEELTRNVVELKQELAKEKATIASGTRSENPGKIRKLRRDIARILTVLQTKKGE
jgi:large subunit ribosomal protein L29